jgi:hypothetical protein
MSNKPRHNKDKVIADTGWGIKPDDQPSNRGEAAQATDVFLYDPKLPNIVAIVLRTQRRSFNTAQRVIVEPGRTTIIDINGDPFIAQGLSWGDDNLVEVLLELGATFDPVWMRSLPKTFSEKREYELHKAWAWGAERTDG